ncbi:hypothetical protein QNI16_16790 [Cytophagaceae bacterium YF14B1]|uniref:AlgX/AlgJ SGNH hydrolase-like domain-containing protein n=1 Tax=Xanthocytophaga flava TaxID=3048013 RepID=A0AAE3U9D9_9BACT|nr:hypothetical protein [Xanthocytophaga flavus]MDJ1482163.1 hypothetical protein [Xanthocytophaga flavus]
MLIRSRIMHIIWVALFLLLISLPLLDSYIGILGRNENTENRQLATAPKLKWRKPFEFFRPFETYFNENFQGRSILIKGYSQWKWNWLRSSPFPNKAIIGKSGWLFLGDRNENVLKEYRHLKPYTKEELQKIYSRIRENQQWLASKGIKYYVVIAPNSHSIYPEFLPDNVVKAHKGSYINSIGKYLAQYPDINFIDLKDTLLTVKKQQNKLLYYKTDTHWNQYGAFIGYTYIINQIRKDFPAIIPLSLSQYKWREHGFSGDLSMMLNLETDFNETVQELYPGFPLKAVDAKRNLPIPSDYTWDKTQYLLSRCTENLNLPKAVIYRDSFSGSLIPYFSENFSESLFIWEKKIRKEVIEQEKPDIVIHEIVERLVDDAFLN